MYLRYSSDASPIYLARILQIDTSLRMDQYSDHRNMIYS